MATSQSKLQSRIWFFSLVNELNDIPAIFEKLKASNASLAFAICHDRDRICQDDGSTIPKRPHTHFLLRFDSPYNLSSVARIFGLDTCDYHLVQKCKNFKQSARYMLHLENKDKVRYDIGDIVPLKGSKDDYYNIAIGVAQYVTTDADLFPWFGDFDKMPYKKQYLEVYNGSPEPKKRMLLLKDLNKCWENYLDMRRYEMETKNVKVIFVEGPAGSGKSTFAKSLAINNHKTFCISSSSNDVLQDYTCEDFLILDDLRDSSFSFEDLLKVLDNYVLSTVKSRYKNKMFLGECIVITSAKPLCEWYSDITEDKMQLYRRISTFARCRRVGNALIADLYVPKEGTAVIGADGKPNGVPVPCPIMELTPQMVSTVEQVWAELGIDLASLADQSIKQFQENPKQLNFSNLSDPDDDLPDAW